MRGAASRPGPSPARGEEKGRGQKAAGQEGGNRSPEEGGRQKARSEEEGGGWAGGPEEEGRRPEEEGGQCAEGRKRPPEEGKRAAQEDRRPTAAAPEGEEVDVRLARECVVSADFNAETEKAKVAEHHLLELRRTPHDGVRLLSLLGTGVKIVSGAAHFHGFGVARQGPWVTGVKIVSGAAHFHGFGVARQGPWTT